MSAWASELAEAIMEKSKSASGADQTMHIAKIVSTQPISIKLYDQVVSRYVYVDPSYTSISQSEIDTAFEDTGELPEAITNLLIKSIKNKNMKSGDTVIVYQNGVSFYVLAKVG